MIDLASVLKGVNIGGGQIHPPPPPPSPGAERVNYSLILLYKWSRLSVLEFTIPPVALSRELGGGYLSISLRYFRLSQSRHFRLAAANKTIQLSTLATQHFKIYQPTPLWVRGFLLKKSSGNSYLKIFFSDFLWRMPQWRKKIKNLLFIPSQSTFGTPSIIMI